MEPTVEGEKVEVGGTVDQHRNVITNLPTLPEGTTVTDVTPGGTGLIPTHQVITKGLSK